MEDTTTTSHDDHTKIASWILFIFGWFINSLKHLTVDHALQLIFHLLSIVSVLLVIIINWEKAMDKLFPNRKKIKKS